LGNKSQNIFSPEWCRVWNLIHAYEENGEVIVKTLWVTMNQIISFHFKDLNVENISQVLFPDKTKDLYGISLYVAFVNFDDALKVGDTVYGRWTYFIDIVAEKLNATATYIEIPFDMIKPENYIYHVISVFRQLYINGKAEFLINHAITKGNLESYSYEEYCFIVPLPPRYSIVELILILPLDNFCWMFLGISVMAAMVVWSVFEGSKIHWNFLFGMFSFFVGQGAKIEA
jgi:hypothetical protein